MPRTRLDGPDRPFHGSHLGQLIGGAEDRRLQVGWRRTGKGFYALTLSTNSTLTPRPMHVVVELEEVMLTSPSIDCTQPSLAIRGMSIDGTVTNPIGAEGFLLGLIDAYREKHPDETPKAGESASAEMEDLTAVNPPEPAAAAAVTTSATINRIFQQDMLDANVAYLETITGPAYQSDGKVLVYRVDGCEVVVLARRGKVRALGMRNMDDRCHFNLTEFLPDLPAFPTYRQLAAHFTDGTWRASCLTNCGNALSPSTYFQGMGMHSEAFQEVVAHSVDLPDSWREALEQRYGEAWLEQRKFNCDGVDNLPGIALAEWGDKHPYTLMVGFGMMRQGCRTPDADFTDDQQATGEP